jgi:hypothetical protein
VSPQGIDAATSAALGNPSAERIAPLIGPVDARESAVSETPKTALEQMIRRQPGDRRVVDVN